MSLRKRSIFSHPVRYFIVIVLGYCFDFLAYAGLVEVGVSIYIANVLSFTAGTAINVVLVRRYVFTDSRFKLLNDIALTLVSNGLVFLVGLFCLWLFADRLAINVYVAKLGANGITFLINYITRATFFRSR